MIVSAKEDIIRLAARNERVEAIARTLNRSEDHVKAVIRKARSSGRLPRRSLLVRRLSDAERAAVLDDWANTNLSIHVIAVKHRVAGAKAVRRIVERGQRVDDLRAIGFAERDARIAEAMRPPPPPPPPPFIGLAQKLAIRRGRSITVVESDGDETRSYPITLAAGFSGPCQR